MIFQRCPCEISGLCDCHLACRGKVFENPQGVLKGGNDLRLSREPLNPMTSVLSKNWVDASRGTEKTHRKSV